MVLDFENIFFYKIKWGQLQLTKTAMSIDSMSEILDNLLKLVSYVTICFLIWLKLGI